MNGGITRNEKLELGRLMNEVLDSWYKKNRRGAIKEDYCKFFPENCRSFVSKQQAELPQNFKKLRNGEIVYTVADGYYYMYKGSLKQMISKD